MKIIKHGKYYEPVIKHGNRSRVITCEICKCVFQYKNADIKQYHSPLTGAEVKVIKCPECKCYDLLEIQTESMIQKNAKSDL